MKSHNIIPYIQVDNHCCPVMWPYHCKDIQCFPLTMAACLTHSLKSQTQFSF